MDSTLNPLNLLNPLNMKAADCKSVKRFCGDQLRWCGYPGQLKEIELLFTEHGDPTEWRNIFIKSL